LGRKTQQIGGKFSLDGRRAVLYENAELRNAPLEELEETLGRAEHDLNRLTPQR
jgi:hypothetical protein